MSKYLQVAIEAAEAGSQYALKHFTGHSSFTYKTYNTPVTKTDVETEEIIKKIILKSFPDAKVIVEEAGGKVSNWRVNPGNSAIPPLPQLTACFIRK
jgi:fructose-1,6-bisphosphatase/inositol monophosphatase family enzyme